MKIWICPFAIMVVLLMLTSSCKKEKHPELSTTPLTNIASTTATSGGNITSDGEALITVRGVCWSTTTNPTISDNKTNNGPGIGSFTSFLSGLAKNTTYYVRTYATNSSGTFYGNEVSFKTFLTGVGIVTDIDGNDYHTVTIGQQVWMVENLKTTKYRNGDPITKVTDKSSWSSLTVGAYCNYDNNSNNSITYGRLYNSYAVRDIRNLSPIGWHVATNGDWTGLADFVQTTNVQASILKEIGTNHWQSPNAGATNETGFTALPGGCFNGDFKDIGNLGYWWTTTEMTPTMVWYSYLSYNSFFISVGISSKYIGLSVRCIKDN